MLHLLFLLESKLTSVTSGKTSISRKRYTVLQSNKKIFWDIPISNNEKFPQPTKKIKCPVSSQTETFDEKKMKFQENNEIRLNLEKN